MNTIITIGISIIGLFILFILLKKGKNISDFFLILINLILVGILCSDIAIRQEFTLLNFFFQNTLPFWLTPVFLTYGLLLIDKTHQLKSNWWWVYSYALGFTIFILLDLTILSSYSPALLMERYKHPTLVYHLFYKMHFIFVIALSFWFLKQLKKHDLSIKTYYSFIEPIKLRWFKHFIIVILIINALLLVVFLIYNFGFIADVKTVYDVLNGSIVISFLFLSFNGIKQYSYVQFKDNLDAKNHPSQEKEKYNTSPLSESKLKIIFQSIDTLFKKEKIFLKPQLKIGEVAEQLNIPSHHLSQAINVQFGKTFFDYVNTFRVAELKEKLKEPENKKFTIISLAYESGFNSKASVNRIFKEQTGNTPSQYQKTHILN